MDFDAYLKAVAAAAESETLPRKGPYLELVESAIEGLTREDPAVRNGGMVYLRGDIPTLVLPDLHGRRDFFASALGLRLDREETAARLLEEEQLQLVCLGDGFHGEARVLERWREAYREFRGGFKRHAAMDKEMTENFETMAMVMMTKLRFPRVFHFLKGNHENILNEDGGGNYAFGKFVNEGEMVTAYVSRRYGEDFIRRYAAFEKSLPLMAQGKGFLISHAEPARPFDEEEIIEYRTRPEVIYGLTWTGNDEAAEGSVLKMLKNFFPDTTPDRLFYLGGHRPVAGLYNIRGKGFYFQIHNPGKRVCAYLPAEEHFDPEKHIFEIPGTVR